MSTKASSPVTHNPQEDAFYEKVDPRAPRDWPEDFSEENGRYRNICCICSEPFIGHKRRMVCKRCSLMNRPSGVAVNVTKGVAELLFAIEAAIPFVDAANGGRTCSSSGGPVALREILEKYNWLEERWRWL